MKIRKAKKNKKWFQNGFTLLFATLVASLLLSLGISILDITLQNFILSSAGRESQFAFYAADSGLECAEYWDRQYFDSTTGRTGSAFTPAPNDTSYVISNPTTIRCNNSSINLAGSSADYSDPTVATVTQEGPIGNDATTTTTFKINLADSETNECFAVAIIKSAHVEKDTDGNINDAKSRYHTTIQSRGYNTCDPTNLRRLERGIKVDY